MGDESGAFIVTVDGWDWRRIPGSEAIRFYTPACGLIENSGNGREVVVVFKGECHILNLETLSWKRGPGIPGSLSWAATVQLEDTFLVTGGWNRDDVMQDSIWQFEPEWYMWIEWPEKLAMVRMDHAAVGIASCP